MLNLIFAVGGDGEFGSSSSPNGLPWHCPSDMAFFRAMTRYRPAALTDHFKTNQVLNFLRDTDTIWCSNSKSVLLTGAKTAKTMKIPVTADRAVVKVSRTMIAKGGHGSLQGLADSYTALGVTPFLVGGKQLIESALAEHSAGKLCINNMFVSCIKAQAKESDVKFDFDKLMMYIDSDFTYNSDEFMENDTVFVSRFRGKNEYNY